MEVSVEIQRELISALTALGQKHWSEHPAIVVFVTGLVTLAGAFFQKWSDLRMKKADIETQKQLGMQTLQLEALAEIFSIVHEIDPGPEPFVGADYHDWVGPKVFALSAFVRRTHDFLGSRGYLVPNHVAKRLRRSIELGDKYKAGVAAGGQGYEPTDYEKAGLIETHNEASHAIEDFKSVLGVQSAYEVEADEGTWHINCSRNCCARTASHLNLVLCILTATHARIAGSAVLSLQTQRSTFF